MVSEAGDRDIC